MDKLREAICRELARQERVDPAMFHVYAKEASALLAAMCEGEALEEMDARARAYTEANGIDFPGVLIAALTGGDV